MAMRRIRALAYGGPLYAVGLGTGLLNGLVRRYAQYKPVTYPAHAIEPNIKHVREICDAWQAALGRLAPGETFAGKRILELGPGHNLGTGMVLLARGARAYTAIDIFPLVHRAPATFYDSLASVEHCSPDLVHRLAFQIVDFPDLQPLTGSFDVAVSNATLEHVEDIPATFRSLRRRVADYMLHHVDAKVHLRVRAVDPLNHLRYSDRVYRWMHYRGQPNRMLYHDYRQSALEAGFNETGVSPRSVACPEYLNLVRPHLAPAFRMRDDLNMMSFTMFAR